MHSINNKQEKQLYKLINHRIESYKKNPVTFTREEIMKEYDISEKDLDNTEEIEFDYE